MPVTNDFNDTNQLINQYLQRKHPICQQMLKNQLDIMCLPLNFNHQETVDFFKYNFMQSQLQTLQNWTQYIANAQKIKWKVYLKRHCAVDNFTSISQDTANRVNINDFENYQLLKANYENINWAGLNEQTLQTNFNPEQQAYLKLGLDAEAFLSQLPKQ